ncbi:hypothetical protein AYJ54_00195 [Bradyrhizobium centrolobii]|uniref:Uncharacterized protein n=2 Tax=Bradyrhizobium TaxID=374 RepID=A0A176Z1Q9_9BRAD|nr:MULTISPECIES: hypothetical protein [Bradyrhizobium]OAF09207.1 hypothetical protein AYJ54_00195 [Bradyrhizobium centrolobii]OAF13130.1 hypothetical protein AXW67_18795 [Bradyrhizobium neotropicale]
MEKERFRKISRSYSDDRRFPTPATNVAQKWLTQGNKIMSTRRAWVLDASTHRDVEMGRLRTQLEELNRRLTEIERHIRYLSEIEPARARAIMLCRELDNICASAEGIEALTNLLRK